QRHRDHVFQGIRGEREGTPAAQGAIEEGDATRADPSAERSRRGRERMNTDRPGPPRWIDRIGRKLVPIAAILCAFSIAGCTGLKHATPERPMFTGFEVEFSEEPSMDA